MVAFALWIVAKVNLEVVLGLPVELPYFYQGRDIVNYGARCIALIVSWGLAAYVTYFATTLPGVCAS